MIEKHAISSAGINADNRTTIPIPIRVCIRFRMVCSKVPEVLNNQQTFIKTSQMPSNFPALLLIKFQHCLCAAVCQHYISHKACMLLTLCGVQILCD